MNKKVIKGFYIGIFGLICLSFVMLTFSLLLRIVLIQPIDSMVNNYLKNISPIYLVSTIVILIASFIGFINSLSLPPTSRNEVEKALLPVVFVSFSFLAIPSLVNYLLVGHIFTISFIFLARLYLFTAFFSFALLVVSGIFSLGINSSKMGRYILLIGVLALFVTTMMELNISLYPQHSIRWTNKIVFIPVLSLIAIVSCINYWAIYVRESTQHNMLKALRVMLILIGAIGFISFSTPVLSLISSLFYTVGVFFGLSRRRFNQL